MDTSVADRLRGVLLQHFRNPALPPVGPGGGPPVFRRNRTCGDRVEIRIAAESGVVASVEGLVEGCAVTTGLASLLAMQLPGMGCAAAAHLLDSLDAAMEGGGPLEEIETALGDLAAVALLRDLPARRECGRIVTAACREALEEAR